MKGIILAGGEGTRLSPLTKAISKQLLPIGEEPMVFYPIRKLIEAGITEIQVITAREHAGQYLYALGEFDFKKKVTFSFKIQPKPEGIAQAFILSEAFLSDADSVAMILGDNLFDASIVEEVKNFKNGANIFVREVPEQDRTRLGIAELDENNKVLSIEEKPKHPKSPYAVTGIYIYDDQVVNAAKSLTPSARGELEITDLNNWYLDRNQLSAHILEGEWIDAGTFESYRKANEWAYSKTNKTA